MKTWEKVTITAGIAGVGLWFLLHQMEASNAAQTQTLTAQIDSLQKQLTSIQDAKASASSSDQTTYAALVAEENTVKEALSQAKAKLESLQAKALPKWYQPGYSYSGWSTPQGYSGGIGPGSGNQPNGTWYVIAPFQASAGTYKLTVTVDDGCELFIDGHLIGTAKYGGPVTFSVDLSSRAAFSPLVNIRCTSF